MIVLGSGSQEKLRAVVEAFARMFPGMEADGLPVDSGVSAQPLGLEETLRGARQRVAAVRGLRPQAQWFVGLEAGLLLQEGICLAITLACIQNREGREHWGMSPGFEIPGQVRLQAEQGVELRTAIQRQALVWERPQPSSALEFLSHGRFQRGMLNRLAVQMALLPFLEPSPSWVGKSE